LQEINPAPSETTLAPEDSVSRNNSISFSLHRTVSTNMNCRFKLLNF